MRPPGTPHHGARLSSLGPRILLSALASALVAVTLLWFSALTARRFVFEDVDRLSLTEMDQEMCALAPNRWQKEFGGFLSIWAYDAHEGTSQNPLAPPLKPGHVAPPVGEIRSWDDHGERTALLRKAEQGPCSLFVLRVTTPPFAAIRAHISALALGGVLAIFAVAGLTLLLAVRPLVRRIRRLRDAAQLVGDERYPSAQDATGDELGVISSALDGSHQRLLADRKELIARQEALERHLAEIAHDLRTPLASLLLATEELSNGEVLQGEALAVAARALEDTVYLESLVDNLRQAALLRHGLDPLAEDQLADLGEVLRRVVERFRALGRRRQVEVEGAAPDEPVIVRCPPALAERALSNLVHNAVVHGRAGGHVAVLLERDERAFHVEVLDDGPGLPPKELASFDQRTFMDGSVRPRGQGLGLAITREIAARAGWELQHRSLEAGGLAVCIRGPLAR